jgi:FkbM family methyltransferase
MPNLARKIWNRSMMVLAKPYIYRELPGWGYVYRTLIGGYQRNAAWADSRPQWMRGKLHGYEIPLNLHSWTNREFFFLGRYFDVGNQFLLKAAIAPGDTVVDIGANEGMIAMMAARVVGASGKVIAFEPNPAPRNVMARAVARNQLDWIDIRPFGLSDEANVLTLTVPEVNSGEGSFGRPSYDATDVETIKCEVRVGDAELAGEMPRLIKIDVEGFELHVLRGLRETIRRAKPLIVVEMVARHLANAGTTPEAVFAELQEAGYRGWRMGQTGRGRTLRAALYPAEITPDLWNDFLWIHPDDPLVDELPARLARTGLN